MSQLERDIVLTDIAHRWLVSYVSCIFVVILFLVVRLFRKELCYSLHKCSNCLQRVWRMSWKNGWCTWSSRKVWNFPWSTDMDTTLIIIWENESIEFNHMCWCRVSVTDTGYVFNHKCRCYRGIFHKQIKYYHQLWKRLPFLCMIPLLWSSFVVPMVKVSNL